MLCKKFIQTNMNWMYEGAQGQLNNEDYLLGKKIDKNFELHSSVAISAPKAKIDVVVDKPSRNTEANRNGRQILSIDTIRKEDPLVAIKTKEEQMRREMFDNPVKMKKLQKIILDTMKKKMSNNSSNSSENDSSSSDNDSTIESESDRKSSKRRKRKRSKTGKKSKDNRKHSTKKRRRKTSRSPSLKRSESPGSSTSRGLKSQRRRSETPEHRRETEESRYLKRYKLERDNARDHRRCEPGVSSDSVIKSHSDRRDDSDHRNRNKSNSTWSRRTDEEVGTGSTRDRGRRKHIEGTATRTNYSTNDYSERRKANSYSKRDDRSSSDVDSVTQNSDGNYARKMRTVRHNESKSRSRTPEPKSDKLVSGKVYSAGRPVASDRVDSPSSLDGHSPRSLKSRKSDLTPPRKPPGIEKDSERYRSSDSGSDEDGDKKKKFRGYGLITVKQSKEEAGSVAMRQEFADKCSKEFRKADVLDPAASASGNAGSGRKPRKNLSTEERDRLLAEMQQNADWREEQRDRNLKRIRTEETVEELSRTDKKKSSAAIFINPMLSSYTSNDSVAGRIKRNIKNLQRGSASDGKFLSK